VTDDRGQGGRHLRYLVAADGDHDENGDRCLGHIEQPGNGGPAEADRARHVGAAGTAAADGARIWPADQARNDDPEGDAAQKVAGDQSDGDPDEVDGLHRREV